MASHDSDDDFADTKFVSKLARKKKKKKNDEDVDEVIPITTDRSRRRLDRGDNLEERAFQRQLEEAMRRSRSEEAEKNSKGEEEVVQSDLPTASFAPGPPSAKRKKEEEVVLEDEEESDLSSDSAPAPLSVKRRKASKENWSPKVGVGHTSSGAQASSAPLDLETSPPEPLSTPPAPAKPAAPSKGQTSE